MKKSTRRAASATRTRGAAGRRANEVMVALPRLAEVIRLHASTAQPTQGPCDDLFSALDHAKSVVDSRDAALAGEALERLTRAQQDGLRFVIDGAYRRESATRAKYPIAALARLTERALEISVAQGMLQELLNRQSKVAEVVDLGAVRHALLASKRRARRGAR